MQFRFSIVELDGNLRRVDVRAEDFDQLGHLVMTKSQVRSLMELIKPTSEDGDTAEFVGPDSVHHRMYHGRTE